MPAGLVIDYWAAIGGTLNGPVTFPGDVTFFVESPVYCNGPVLIEGGAVFKFPKSTGHDPTTTYLRFNNSVTTTAGDFRPVIFTAADDWNVGDDLNTTVWSGYTGITSGKYYANPGIWLACPTATLSNLRFNFAQEAVRVDGATAAETTVFSLSHSQFVNCLRGVNFTGILHADPPPE